MEGTLQHRVESRWTAWRRDRRSRRSAGIKQPGRSGAGNRARSCLSMDRLFAERRDVRQWTLRAKVCCATIALRSFERRSDRPAYRSLVEIDPAAGHPARGSPYPLLRTGRYETGTLVRGAIGRSGDRRRCLGLLGFLRFAVASLLTFGHVTLLVVGTVAIQRRRRRSFSAYNACCVGAWT